MSDGVFLWGPIFIIIKQSVGQEGPDKSQESLGK